MLPGMKTSSGAGITESAFQKWRTCFGCFPYATSLKVGAVISTTPFSLVTVIIASDTAFAEIAMSEVRETDNK
jgi:hypothetical protein